jgi:hypothetical protein
VVQIKTLMMKKIVILSIVCLVSGSLFAQSSAASDTKTTTPVVKVDATAVPVVATAAIAVAADMKTDKVQPATATVPATKVVAGKKPVAILATAAASISPIAPEVQPVQVKPDNIAAPKKD